MHKAMDEYRRRILKGSSVIADKIRELAKEHGIEGIKIEWDGEKQISIKEDFHILKVYSGNKSCEARLFVEEIEGFPYNGEETIKKITNLVKRLKPRVSSRANKRFQLRELSGKGI
jgi:hypothetical protein